MKKFISVALATALIASMGVTSFAKNTYPEKLRSVDLYNGYYIGGDHTDELYFPLRVGNKMIVDNKDKAVLNAKDAADALVEKTVKDYIGTASLYTKLKDGIIVAVNAANPKTTDEANEAQINAIAGFIKTSSMTDGEAKDAAKKLAITITPNRSEIDGKFDLETYKTSLGTALTNTAKLMIEMAEDNIGKPLTDKLVADKGYAYTEEDYGGFAKELLTQEYMNYDDIEDIDDMDIKLKMKQGTNWLDTYYLDEVEDLNDVYCVVVELKTNTASSKQRFAGTLTLKDGGKELDEKQFYYNYNPGVVFSVSEYGAPFGDPANGLDPELVYMDNDCVYINLVEFNSKYRKAFFKKNVLEVEIEDNNGFYFTVETSDQGKVNLAYDNKAVDKVTEMVSKEADLTFFNFYAYPMWDMSGTVEIALPDDYEESEAWYLYSLEQDGKVYPVNAAKLTEDGDALTFKTNRFSRYILSNEEIDWMAQLAPIVTEDPTVAGQNPETGATK